MTKLSVNINKIATLRNARGGNNPDVVKAAKDCQYFGADGITVHPRPDQRHIRYEDVYNIKEVISTEFNIEGNPTREFIDLVLKVLPDQVTLVPDAPDALTSNQGWDTLAYFNFLSEVIAEFKAKGVRTSIFLDPVLDHVERSKKIGVDCIELYTESYALGFPIHPEKSVQTYKDAAQLAYSLGLGINAGHDLNLQNLKYFNREVEHLQEVSIGHALICDSLYYGLENAIQMYKNCLTKN